ncbi:KinB-signaling pathway activation protein [Fictibacillus aquaticus]|uniref:KINB signaling pathway activation protein n=1 Tax=Fictibacillus aquaticus TaxID=2021314 RepID=A0A235F7I8_9BACL|nr:KinB-signaling pathway activation protein [Fictibacillus aquaticus]OYD57034.1 KINB signaling pathway activation protein [Fictibacillus aquaticus]
MNSRNWVFLFTTTLLIGTISAIATGFILQFPESGSLKEIGVYILGLVGFGALFSVFSQMGFFAYLTVHRFGLGIFKSKGLWEAVQLLVIAVVIFDLFYLRYSSFHKEGEALVPYIVIPAALLIYALVIALLKSKMTNQAAFIPTLFFISVVTTLEWVPVLKQNNPISMWITFVPLILCNTYQILMLHRLNTAKNKPSGLNAAARK